MLTPRDLEKSPLFQGIEHDEYMAMVHCFQAVRRTFRPDELICDLTAPGNNRIGIVERGEAVVIRVDEAGVSTVMEELRLGGVFGNGLAFSGSANDSVEVLARTTCEVMFIDYPHIFKRCERACTHHSVLVQNMVHLLSEKTQGLSQRVDVLSRRSIREKLLCYFHQQAARAGGPNFRLPFSLSMLADYIATDRSAMMRELKKLKDEGILSSDGRQIRLLQ
jgi:CRP-like cAMP-binding protein